MLAPTLFARTPDARLDSLQATLVRLAILNHEQVRDAVAATQGTPTTWIEYLLLSGLLDEQMLAGCAATLAVVPRCARNHLERVPRHVLAMVPADLAIEHRVVPIRLEPDGDLGIAMIDPTDLAAVEEVGFFVGRNLLREVALATTIAWALDVYYRGTVLVTH